MRLGEEGEKEAGRISRRRRRREGGWDRDECGRWREGGWDRSEGE